MTDSPNTELLEKILRELQEGHAAVKQDLELLRDGQLQIRDDLHSLKGDVLRQEHQWARFATDLERLKTAIGVTEQPDA